MTKINAFGFCCLLSFLQQNYLIANAAPTDRDSIIIIPYKTTEKEITKIKSFKIDGDTAIKQFSSRISPENIVRTLSKVPEFDILIEGLDAITIGDVYKAAFPKGILRSISEQFLKKTENDILSPSNEGDAQKSTEIASENETKDVNNKGILTDNTLDGSNLQSEHVLEPEPDIEYELNDLKEQPITDDYVYDQPIENRFADSNKKIANADESSYQGEDSHDSNNLNPVETSDVVKENPHIEVEKNGARFVEWFTQYVLG